MPQVSDNDAMAFLDSLGPAPKSAPVSDSDAMAFLRTLDAPAPVRVPRPGDINGFRLPPDPFGYNYNPDPPPITQDTIDEALRVNQMTPTTKQRLAESDRKPYSPQGPPPALDGTWAGAAKRAAYVGQGMLMEGTSPIIDMVFGVPIRFLSAASGKMGGPTTDFFDRRVADALPAPTTNLEAGLRGGSAIVGETASFLVPSIPGAMASKAAEAAGWLTKLSKWSDLTKKAVGLSAGVAGFTSMEAATKALKDEHTAGQALGEIAQSGPSFVSAMLQAPGNVARELADMLADGTVKPHEIQRLTEAVKPITAVALAHKLGAARESKNEKQALLSREGALTLSITRPDVAARLVEAPARVSGIPNMSRVERIELGRLIRQIRAQEPVRIQLTPEQMAAAEKAGVIENPESGGGQAAIAQAPSPPGAPAPPAPSANAATPPVPPVEAAPPAIKQPWEMTRDEYESSVKARVAADPNTAWLKEHGFSGEVIVSPTRHFNAVYNAIKEGKSVPPEVLADYPDLTAPATPDARATAATGGAGVKQPWEMTKADAIEKAKSRAKELRKEWTEVKRQRIKISPGDPSYARLSRTRRGEDIGYRNKIAEAEKFANETAAKYHRMDVQTAIREGKITSHPDYPELSKNAETTTPNPERTVIPNGKEEGQRQGQGLLSPDTPAGRTGEVPPPGVSEGDSRIIGLSLRKVAEQRAARGQPPLTPAELRERQVAMNQALNSGAKESALDVAVAAMRGENPKVDEVTQHALLLKEAELELQISDSHARAKRYKQEGNTGAAELEEKRMLESLNDINILEKGNKLIGTELARMFGARNSGIELDTGRFVPAMQAAREANGDKPVSKETQEKISDWTSKIAERDKEIADLRKTLADKEAENARLAAEAVAKETTRAARRHKETSERILSERADIKKQLAAKGLQVNTLAGIDPEGVHLIGKLALSYIKERKTANLKEIVDQVIKDIPTLEPRDVWQAINARNPKAIDKATKETQSRVRNLKTQARMLNEIAAFEGGEDVARAARQPRNDEIKALQKKLDSLRKNAYKSIADGKKLDAALKKIDELQEHLRKGTKEAKRDKENPSPELAAARQKIGDLRRILSVNKDIAEYQRQLDTGDIKVPAKKEPRPVSRELSEKLIERASLKKDIDKEIERLRLKTEWENMKAGAKAWQTVKNANAELRSILATGDMSGVMRQGLVLSVRRPRAAARAFVKAAKAMFSQKSADQVMVDIKESPSYRLSQEAKLELTEIDGPLNFREEYFAGRLLERIPGLGRILGPVIRGSNRHMATYLNLMRKAAFDQFLASRPNATLTELTQWADFVNKASGRGNLNEPGALARSISGLSHLMFAPKFAASRFQTPAMLWKRGLSPRVRTEVAKDMAATLGVGVTALTFAALAGAKVGLDPKDSDFGKIVLGDTHIDFWAGFQPVARLILGSIAKTYDIQSGVKSPSIGRYDIFNDLGRFFSYKLNPSITLAHDLAMKRDLIGNKVDVGETLSKRLVPLLLTDVREAYENQGKPAQAAVTGALSAIGVGVGTYQKD